jgi:hypothetical protein
MLDSLNLNLVSTYRGVPSLTIVDRNESRAEHWTSIAATLEQEKT